MVERRYFEGVSGVTQFTRKELLESFRMSGYMLSEASFYKWVEELVKGGQIIRIGARYCALHTLAFCLAQI